MSNARCLTAVSVLCLVIGCGGNNKGGSGDAGGGGNTPSLSVSPSSTTVVAGGSAVNFSSTLLNATGTVSWALSGPGSINPTTGSGTTYTPPASVGAATGATLTATSGPLTATATITVNSPAIITVAGSVKDAYGKGIAGATVLIGAQTTTTDGIGAFSLGNVTTPYDATVVQGSASRTYKGLTRGDPTLVSPQLGNPPNHGTVTGSVSGGDSLPAPSDRTAVAWGSPEITAKATVANNPWTLNLGWAGASSTLGNVHALQWTPTSGMPTAYKGYGVSNGVSVDTGGNTTGVAVAMTAPTASTIGGTIALPAGVSLLFKDLSIDFADGASFAVATDLGSATAFSYAVPGGIGSTATVSVSGSYPGTGGTFARVSGLTPGSTATSITLLVPTTYSTPLDGATGVTTSTDFTWTPLPGAVYLVSIFSTVAGAPSYGVFTSATSTRIPDLSALGITLPASATYSWAIQPVAPWASVDDLAGGTAMFPSASTIHFSIVTGRKFTTQ
jgi:hypothetical protein